MEIKEIEEKLAGVLYTMFICKVCGNGIAIGLCNYRCIHDSVDLKQRPKGSVAKVTYKFEKVEDM
jgi:hypothetical protein